MPLVRELYEGPKIYNVTSYVLNKYMCRLVLSGYFQFPITCVAPNYIGIPSIINITPKYLFELALKLNPIFAEKFALSGILGITINTLLSCLEVRGCLNIEPVANMIHSIAMLPTLSRSFAGVTIHSCIDLYDEAVIYCGKQDDIRCRETRENLQNLDDRMTSVFKTR